MEQLKDKIINTKFRESSFSIFSISLLHYIIIPILILSISSCKIYRFTDASVDPNWKTFSVTQTTNIATLQNPNAAPNFTEKIKEN